MKDSTVMTLRENGQLEAKRAKGGVPESIWETYSAFANTNGGLIILGAEEGPKGEVECVGVPNPEQLVKKFWDGVHNPSKVSANILTNDSITIETINDCDIIRIQVPRANRHLRPIYICGNREKGTYRRDGEGDYRCSSEEIVAMIRDASNEPLDDTVLEEFPLDALSWDTVSRYRAVVSAARPNHPWLKLDDEEFLVELNAIGRTNGEGEFHPTRAGLLMFGFEYEIAKEYANYFLDYREADQERRWADRITSQDGTWTGNLFDFWTEALPRLTSGLKKPFALDNNLQRIEDTEMHAAIREALANALVHSDYYGRRGIVALRYSDRIEIANPGNSRVALDVVRAGGISDARNPTLVRMFGLTSACERMGSGFDVMSNAAKAASATEAGRANGATGSLEGPYDGYAECVKATFDEGRVTVTELMGYFFEIIDPYSVNRQGADVGEKYRTGVYSEDPSHLREAEAYIRARPDRDRIRVEVLPLARYVPSAEEHQDHLDKFPDDYCHILRELMTKYLPKE